LPWANVGSGSAEAAIMAVAKTMARAADLFVAIIG
jgi:hypothetical protein